jgi:Icc protein
MTDKIIHDHHHDGIDRRGFLKCMAWVGTGVLYTLNGGVLVSESISRPSFWLTTALSRVVRNSLMSIG